MEIEKYTEDAKPIGGTLFWAISCLYKFADALDNQETDEEVRAIVSNVHMAVQLCLKGQKTKDELMAIKDEANQKLMDMAKLK